jgi:hypothetical protein
MLLNLEEHDEIQTYLKSKYSGTYSVTLLPSQVLECDLLFSPSVGKDGIIGDIVIHALAEFECSCVQQMHFCLLD